LCVILRFFLIWENRSRDRKTGPVEHLTEDEVGVVNMADSTDKEMVSFRYVY
jgi:hypothetical protein